MKARLRKDPLDPIDVARCPWCGGPLTWYCYDVGKAHCGAGKYASQVDMPADLCDWPGGKVVRLADDRVVVDKTDPSWFIPSA